MHALKRAEQSAGVVHVEARPVIANVKCHLTFLLDPSELYERLVSLSSKFDSVAEQVSQRDLQQPRIAESYQLRRDNELHTPLRLGVPQFARNTIRQCREVNWIQLHFVPSHAR